MASGLKLLAHFGGNARVDSEVGTRNVGDGVGQIAQDKARRSGSLVWRQSEVDEVQDGLQNGLRNRPAACGARSKVRLIKAEDNDRAHYKARPCTPLHMIGIF